MSRWDSLRSLSCSWLRRKESSIFLHICILRWAFGLGRLDNVHGDHLISFLFFCFACLWLSSVERWMYWSGICLAEVDSVLQYLNRSEVPVEYPFKMLESAPKFVIKQELTFGNYRVYSSLESRVIVQFLYSSVPMYLFFSALGQPKLHCVRIWRPLSIVPGSSLLVRMMQLGRSTQMLQS